MSKFSPPKAEVGDLAVGRGDDAVDPAGLVADLDAHPGRDVEPAVAVDAHAVGAGVVGGVGDVQVIILLLVGKRAVGLDLVAVDPVGAAVGDVEQRLVGRERDAVGELQAGVDDLLLALGADVPDLARLAGVSTGVGDVEAAVVADDQVVAAKAIGDHGRTCPRRRRPEPGCCPWPRRRAGRRARTPGRWRSWCRRGTGSPCRRGRSCRSCCWGCR